MGYGLPSSIGSCVANKYKKNICLFESDGSFMFNLQELATISSYKLPIKIFLMNNQGYASIRNTQKVFLKKIMLVQEQRIILIIQILNNYPNLLI